MKNLKLSTKLMAAFLGMALLVLIGGLLGPLGISKLGDRLLEITEVRLQAIQGLGMITAAQKSIQEIRRSLLIPESVNNQAETVRLFKLDEEARARAEKGWKILERLPRTREEAVLWNKLKPAWETWGKDQAEVGRLIKEGKRNEALALSINRVDDSFRQTERLLFELSALNLKLGQEVNKSGQALELWQKRLVYTGTGIGIAIALVFGFYFSFSITRPISRTIDGLSKSGARFALASEQISSSSLRLAEGTSKQARATEEIAGLTGGLAATVQQATDQVSALKDIAAESSVIGLEAFDLFKKAKKAMKEIKVSCEETSRIVKTISEIAFQTNLLALSASVEAAQSNEFGMGFSVVAQEVRNLARRSTEAAKATSTHIEETIRLVTRGDGLMRASLGSFIDYGTASADISGFSVKASEVAEKQALGIEQIKTAMGEINRTAEANASSARESGSAARQIKAQSAGIINIVEELKRTVGAGA
jgi:methyl-accepting chemotaxis protein